MTITKRRSPRRMRGAKMVRSGLLAVVLGLAVTGCGAGDDDADFAKDGDMTTVKLGVLPIHITMPVWAAVDQGFFAEQGLNVELNNVTSGPALLSALASGSVDLMMNSPTNAIQAISKGVPLKLVTTTVPKSIYNALATNEVMENCEFANKPYPEPYLCAKGKKVGILALGSESHKVALTELAQVGLTERDVSMVPVGLGEGAAKAMQAGQADIVFGEDTTAIYATKVSRIAQPLVDMKTLGTFADWMGNGAWALDSRLKKSPEVFIKFSDAIAKSIAWMNDPANAATVEEIYKKNAPTASPETISAVVAGTPVGYFGTSATCSSVDNMNTWLVDTELLTAAEVPGGCDVLAGPTAVFSK